MPRKPNYRFDRMERDRQKAAKKAERLEAKQAKAAEKKGLNPDGTPLDSQAEGIPDAEPSELPGSDDPTGALPAEEE